MNTKNLKAYAPKARTQFIEAVKNRAAQFGIYEGEDGKVRIEEVRVEGGAAIIEGRAFTRKEGEQRKRLESKVVERGYDMFIREMAYTWFNRLAALRYMEIHDYFDHGFRVLSPAPNSVADAQGSANVAGDRMSGATPEILSHASDVADSLGLDKSHIIELQLAGDKEEELYRELLLGQCHHLYKIMPFMFEAIDDATELLLPSNLTKTDSILKGLINDIPEEDWQEIEVIGWLYQFYISEHKDAVIGKVVKSEDIPAATQLFTPNWIVKYLVQNSVGRQWLATYPDSELKGKMEYYIEPAEQSEEVIEQLKAITPTSIDPEEIKVLDPACGSGHILVEVYEVLREIYLERGYRLREIPELIITKNIYGLDIDDRAAQLAGFALMMKAREDDRRIFQRVEDGEVSLNVFSLQSTEHLDIRKLWKALDLEGNQQAGSTGGLFDTSDEFIQPTGVYKEYFELLQALKSAFLQAKTLGSLIQIEQQHSNNLVSLKELLEEKRQGSDPAASSASFHLLPIVNQALILSLQYDNVIANPPYMGSKGLNPLLKKCLKSQYSGFDKDLFLAFIDKCRLFSNPNGLVSLMTPNVWMYLNSYYEARQNIVCNNNLESLIELPLTGFKGATVQICCFTLSSQKQTNYKGTYIRLVNEPGADYEMSNATKESLSTSTHKNKFQVSQQEFPNIPGTPISYWVSSSIRDLFKEENSISSYARIREGLNTGDNERFLRFWWEVKSSDIEFNFENQFSRKWSMHNKGGAFRRWYGNQDYIMNWENNGKEIHDFHSLPLDYNGAPVRGKAGFFHEAVSWSRISSGKFSARYFPTGFTYDSTAPSIFTKEDNIKYLLGFLNSKVSGHLLSIMSPTVDYRITNLNRLPVKENAQSERINLLVDDAIKISKEDWNSTETSWDFKPDIMTNPRQLVELSVNESLISAQEKVRKLQTIEKNINQYFIDVFKLGSKLFSDVDLKEISLIRNEFIEGYKNTNIAEYLSLSLGCMMGRYSLNREGLVYADSGNEGFKELEVDGAYKSFPADDDGIIPLASEEWLFDDDATTRFKEFVQTVWGGENLSENLEFIAESLRLHALKPKKGESAMDTIRRYFSTQFFKDHCKTYKKRPIYWLFSSGKEKAFECLVYLHRYNEGTLSRMRTEYVTPLMGKYDAQLTRLSEEKLQASGAEARRIEKDLKALEKKQAELRTFDEQLKHYAEKRITLDLDDGVKANYGKFGNLLADVKAIHGKAVK